MLNKASATHGQQHARSQSNYDPHNNCLYEKFAVNYSNALPAANPLHHRYKPEEEDAVRVVERGMLGRRYKRKCINLTWSHAEIRWATVIVSCSCGNTLNKAGRP